MLTFPRLNPVALSLGPLDIHWYGLMYLLGFALAWGLARRQLRRPWVTVQREQIDDLIFYGALGVVVGGRLGYVLFYNLDRLLAEPSWLFRIWEGGMSFHGGLLGVAAVMLWYSRRTGLAPGALLDFVAPLVPLGLGLGRLGNFIGQELWGRPTSLPWGMVFPADPLALPRHPSQLYQFALEGLLLFAVLWWYAARPRPRWSTAALFLLLYGGLRFLVEFVREPDAHIGLELFGWMSRGQLLSLPMMLGGAALFFWAWHRRGGAGLGSPESPRPSRPGPK